MIADSRRVTQSHRHPRTNIIARMGIWGTAVSALSGCAYFLAIGFGLPYARQMPFDVALIGFAAGSFLSALVGLFYGLLAAHFIGLMMMIAAAIFFPNGSRPRLLKYAFGALTAITIYLVSPFDAVSTAFAQILEGRSSNPLADLTAVAIFLIAVYLSQVVAKKYLREIAQRKPKGKPAAGSVMFAAGDSVDGG